MIRWLLPLLLLVLQSPVLPAGPTRPADRSQPNPEQSARKELLVPAEAHAHGKYRTLLRVILVPQDLNTYQRFHDFGQWNGTEWQGHRDLPQGNWVYVYPNWYIWRDVNPGR